MSRKKTAPKKIPILDPKYKSPIVPKLINSIMYDGKKTIAEKLASEYDYNSRDGRIPLGVIYQSQEPSLEEKWPQLRNLIKKKTYWKNK